MADEPAVPAPEPYWTAPNRKPTVGYIASCMVGMAVWAMHQYGGVTVPGEVIAWSTGLITVVISYFVPEA